MIFLAGLLGSGASSPNTGSGRAGAIPVVEQEPGRVLHFHCETALWWLQSPKRVNETRCSDDQPGDRVILFAGQVGIDWTA